MAGLTVLRAGLNDTIQDLGRAGRRSWGVPVSGAFDLDEQSLANALLGNPADALTLEMTLVGGSYRADDFLAIALAGAPMAAAIERAEGRREGLQIPQSATLTPGDCLILGGTPTGMRTYLAARGGWRLRRREDGGEFGPDWSREDPMRRDDHVLAFPSRTPVRRPSRMILGRLQDDPIRIIDGPDAGLGSIDWEGLRFRLGPRSDRMGLRLEGPPLDVSSDADRDSTPVAPGAVQVAGGQPIILGPACGTMGGYPHVAHVISADLGRMAQLRPGEEVRFQRIEVAEARRIDREDRRRRADRLALIRSAVADDSCGRLIGVSGGPAG